jgi:hypothetical protein
MLHGRGRARRNNAKHGQIRGDKAWANKRWRGGMRGQKNQVVGVCYLEIEDLSKYTFLLSTKQCVHALYLFFVYPERLLRAWQSLMVTKSNARRLNDFCLCSSRTRTPFLSHNCKSYSTNGLRYTSMSFPSCFGPWMRTCIIMNFRFMHNQGGRLLIHRVTGHVLWL